MHRRAFAAGFGALLFSGAAARADFGDLLQQGALRALRLRFGTGEFATIDGFALSDAHRAVGTTWTRALPTFNEDRVDLSSASPVVGNLFRTPFRVRWARASEVGALDLIGTRLVGRVPDAGRHARAQVTIGAGDYSWDLASRLASVPAIPGAGRRVGAVRIEDDGHVLVSVVARPAF